MEFDSETGNYYAAVYPDSFVGARYYDPRFQESGGLHRSPDTGPAVGRFLSADPLGGLLDNPQSLNGYAYVLNNPESLIDPLGMDPTSPPPPPPPVSTCGGEDQTDCGVYYSNGCLWQSGGYTYVDAYGNLVTIGQDDLIACDTSPGAGSEIGGGNPLSPPPTPNPPCTALQQRASQIGLSLQQISGATGFTAGVLGGLGIFSGVGEFFTAGANTPLTVALFAGAGVFGVLSKGTGSLAAAFNSYAEGNPSPLEHFGISQLLDLSLGLAASAAPPVAKAGAQAAKTLQQAEDFMSATKGACQ